MEIIQIDHTPLDVEVTFRGVFRLGKPTLTIARDQFTDAIVGLHLTFGPPSYASVMECLLHVISPKNLIASTLAKCKHGWNMSGLFERLRVDNGAEFRGLDLENAGAQLGFSIDWCPPRKPWFKAQVERSFGVIRSQVISRLRTRTFTVREQQRDNSTDFYPILDIDELREVLTVWAVSVHNETPYVGTGQPPRIAFEQGCLATPPRNDKTDTEIKVYLGACERRALHPYGIELKGLTYTSPELTLLRQQIQRHPNFASREKDPSTGKLLIKYSPADVGSVYVLDPLSNTYIEAKCTLFDYANGLTMHRHRLNLAYARHLAKGTVNAKDLIEASLQLDQMIADLSVTQAERIGAKLARALPSTRKLLYLPEDDDASDAMLGDAGPSTPKHLGDKARDACNTAPQIPTTNLEMSRPLTPTPSLSFSDDDIDDLADAWTHMEST